MHRLIRFIVEAETEKEAMEKATSELNQLVEWGKVDYGTFLWDGGRSPQGWGVNKNAYKFKEKKARELIMTGLLFDYEACLEALRDVKEMLNTKSEYDIASSSDFIDKYTFKKVDMAEFIVYDSTFIDIGEFNFMMEDKDINKLWVVCCDVHT